MAFNAQTHRRTDAQVSNGSFVFLLAFPPRFACASALIALMLISAGARRQPAAAEGASVSPSRSMPNCSTTWTTTCCRACRDLPGRRRNRTRASPPPEGPVPEAATDNPLALIAERMRAVQQRIAGRDTSDETQTVQKQIQADLAALIEQAKKQCAACNKPGSGQGQQAGSTGGNPTPAPPRDSTNRIEQGTKEAVETADVKDVLRRFWGHLPDKVRDQMQASLSEQFLPKYERLIEDYYQRLAEEPPRRAIIVARRRLACPATDRE